MQQNGFDSFGFARIQKDDQLLGMVLRQNGGGKSRGLKIEERFTKNEKWFEEYWRGKYLDHSS